MIAPIAHRGPDGSGIYVDGRVAMGHRRLAIIDLSDDAAQPMQSPDGRLVLSFNGEIYNYLELREELKALGVEFRTHSDSEVILAAYAVWGKDCVTRFNGMWAFVIHDRNRNIVFGSRDRFGKKPLYWTRVRGAIAFASEIRQLLPILPCTRANVRLVTEFLLTSVSDHEDDTYFEGVARIPAGHSFIVDSNDVLMRVERYYRVAIRPEIRSLGLADAAATYKKTFTEAIRLRMRADVKVGTCLSGGLDSSSVAAVASRLYAGSTSEPFTAITAVSEHLGNDESTYAQQVVDRSGLRWVRVRPEYHDFVSALPKVVQTQEEPFASPSICMQFFVMRAAREHGVTVLLDGQGGDETLLGYEKYYAAYFCALLRRHGVIAALQGLRQARRHNSNMYAFNTVKYLVGGLSASARYIAYRFIHRHLRYHGGMPWFLSALAKEIGSEFGLQRLEIERTNLPILLRYEDKNSMAHSVETRLPFLDYRAVETALSLPVEYKIRAGWTKWVLRSAMEDHLPPAIAWRRNKMGFEAPEARWLPRHDSVMQDVVAASDIIAALTVRDRLTAAWRRLDPRSKWRLYSVAMWESRFGVQV